MAKQINVTSVSETPIIKVVVSHENKDLAVSIANELANVFKTEISKIYNLENISVIDKAIVEEKPYNIHFLKQMAIYGAFGFIISCFVLFVVFYFDNTIKSKKEIESRLNLAVLGEIPVASKLESLEKKKNKQNHHEMELAFDEVDDKKYSAQSLTKKRVKKEGKGR